MSAEVANNDTTTRKRKRPEKNSESCFTNSAFSSTPKKNFGRLKENQMPYNNNNGCMEVKSISDLIKDEKDKINPYEIQRKPPKKKKREEENFCFENPALNLNIPEKQFNPFEVVREEKDESKCFINEALNIKCQDSITQVRNPFEITRNNRDNEDDKIRKSSGIENLAMEDVVAPTNLTIGIPFKPTIGCRIDFNNVALSQLTPSKLFLAEKLVFSPVPNAIPKPKRSLDSISEESSSTSIGKELDRYQLELENSINEAKLRKNDGNHCKDEEHVYQFQLKIEKRVSLNQRLSEIPESEEYETEEEPKQIIDQIPIVDEIQVEAECTETTADGVENVNTAVDSINNFDSKEVQEDIKADFDTHSENENGDDDDDEDFDFKAPTPFVRNYRREITVPKPNLADSKESSSKSSSECIAEKNHHAGVKGFIRKSIRRIMPHHKEQVENKAPACKSEETTPNASDQTKQCTLTSHIMSSIRQSLRRKPKAPSMEADKMENEIPMTEISIIDESERKLKLKSSVLRNDYARIEELTNEKKHVLRNGSFRHSMMKSIFHKQEEYTFQK